MDGCTSFRVGEIRRNAIHLGKDNCWFGLNQITRYSTHGAACVRPKPGHTQFMAMTVLIRTHGFQSIGIEGGAHFSDTQIRQISEVSSTRAQRGFDLAAQLRLEGTWSHGLLWYWLHWCRKKQCLCIQMDLPSIVKSQIIFFLVPQTWMILLSLYSFAEWRTN